MKGMLKTLVLVSALLAVVAPAPALAAGIEAATPKPLVDAYGSLADAILAANKTEWNLVHSILSSTYLHAEALLGQAQAKIAAGEDARTELEGLAALVSQLGNEGDASVAAVRKRLLEGGHHHHHHHHADAKDEEQDQYDEGFVIVTRAAKKVFLEASKNIAKLGRNPDAKALEAEWGRVKTQFTALCEGTKG